MSPLKLKRIQAVCDTARYPRTFAARLALIPCAIRDKLTARQIAMIIDGPMESSYQAGRLSQNKEAE